MSNNANDASKPVVKITAVWLTSISIIILMGAIGLLIMTQSEAQTVGAYALFSLFGAIITFGFLGSTGIVKTRNSQFGGAAAFFFAALITLKMSVNDGVTIVGTLYLDDLPVKNAKIYLLNCDISDASRQLQENDQGQFKFTGIRVKPKELEFKIQIPNYKDKIVHYPFKPSNRILIKLHDADLEHFALIHSVNLQAGDIGRTEYGYVTPPSLAANLVAGKSQPDVEGYVNRARMQQSDAQFHRLDENEIKLSRDKKGYWVAVINTKVLIDRQSKNTPHGAYQAMLTLTDNQSQRWVTNLNYVYRLESEPGASPLEAANRHFHATLDGQIKVTNPSTNFVSARLRQGFNFKRDFLIRGVFYITSNSRGRTGGATLDISFGDQWTDLVSVILGEDGGDSYSIKFRKEPVKKNGPQDERNKIEDTGVFVKRDGKTPNFFEIRFCDESDTGRLTCYLYVNSSPIHPKKEKPIFTRQLDGDVLGEGVTKIRLKLWQSGSVNIQQIEVAELAKS